MSIEAMKLWLKALETSWYHVGTFCPTDAAIELYDEARDSLRQAIEQAQKQEPVAFPRQTGDSTWTVDTAFIWRVKHTIDPDTPNDFTPSEEQIETVLLALEKIPFGLFTSPPQRQPEQKPVAYINVEKRTLEFSHDHVKWDTPTTVKLERIPLYTSPPQRQPLSDEEIQKCYETTGHYQTLRPQDRFAVFALARAIEAAHGIGEQA